MRSTEFTAVDFGSMSKQEAERFRSKVEHKTFYNFNVEVCPFQGSYCVTVTTDYDFLEEQNAELQVATMIARVLNNEPHSPIWTSADDNVATLKTALQQVRLTASVPGSNQETQPIPAAEQVRKLVRINDIISAALREVE